MFPNATSLAGQCAAVTPRTGGRPRNPYLRRDWMRRSRRVAAGMSPREVARSEQVDEAEIQGLLQQADFAALVESWHVIDALPQAEQMRRLVALARQAIEQALYDWDVPAAFFVLREDARGRDPAETIAHGIIAASRRRARASTAPPPAAGTGVAPPQPRTALPAPAQPRARLVWRGAEKLRAATAAEHAIRHAASDARADPHTAPPDPAGVAATVAAARRALAGRPDAAARPALPVAARHARHLAFTAGPAALRPATEPIPAGPIAGLPRRPRAP
jgi:hypothetical protein